MGVHLVYRSPYNSLNHKHYRNFEGDFNVLQWFRRLWKFYDEDSSIFYDRVTQYVGVYIYGFWGPFNEDQSKVRFNEDISRIKPPETLAELQHYLLNGYIEEVDVISENAIQFINEDDELYLATYIFDDDYLAENKQLVKYLVQGDWELPTADYGQHESSINYDTVKIKKAEIQNNVDTAAVYVFMVSDWRDGGYLKGLKSSTFEFTGLDLMSFHTYLNSEIEFELLEVDLNFIRSQIYVNDETILDALKRYNDIPEFYIIDLLTLEMRHKFNFDMIVSGSAIEARKYLADYYQSTYQKIDFRNSKRNSRKSRFQYSKHMIQASIHTEVWPSNPMNPDEKNVDLYYHYIIFDSEWRKENEDLAYSILTFGNGWKILK